MKDLTIKIGVRTSERYENKLDMRSVNISCFVLDMLYVIKFMHLPC